MNAIITKKILSGNYLAFCEGKYVASITRAKKRSWVVVNRLGHVRIFPTLFVSVLYLVENDYNF